MTKTMTINNKARTIEMTKKFEKLASRFGTKEYFDLQQARKDYPLYTTRIITTSKKNTSQKGLNYEFMKDYIKKHNERLMENFNTLSGNCDLEEGEEKIKASYGTIKKWFLSNFPELDTKKSKETLAKIKAKEDQKKARIFEILNSIDKKEEKNENKKENNVTKLIAC